MADIKDVINAETEYEESLRLLSKTETTDNVLAFGFAAVAAAIHALGIRLDYVLSNRSNNA